jgi:hypothetical protein
MSSVATFFVQVFRSVVKAASAPASASTVERVASPIISVAGFLVVTAAVWKFSEGTSDEMIIRVVYGSCVLVLGPLGFYFRDRWE